MDFTNKNEDGAVADACKKFGTTKDQLVIKVVQKPRHGFLGIGRKSGIFDIQIKKSQTAKESQPSPVTVQKVNVHDEEQLQPAKSINPSLTAEEKEQLLIQKRHEKNMIRMKNTSQSLLKYIQQIYSALGIKVQPVMKKLQTHECQIDLQTTEEGQVIGYHGRRINAVEQLAVTYLTYQGIKSVRVTLNTGDYRERRQRSLEKLMEQSVTKVIATNQAVFLDPMPARERKVLHRLAENQPMVKTYSHGREPYRSIVIAPQN